MKHTNGSGVSRIAAFLIASVFLFSLFVLTACENNRIPLVSGGEFRYTIVRGDLAAKIEQNAAATLRRTLIEVLGFEDDEAVSLDTDWIDRKTPKEEADEWWEILVGHTNRTATKDALSDLGDADYIIRVTEDERKIVIVGRDEYYTELAVEAFLTEDLGIDMEEKKMKKNISLPKGLDRIVKLNLAGEYKNDGPQIIETVYSTDDVVVADIVVNRSDYGVDPTGMTDSASGIQKALNDCAGKGGGTVFLPAGKYLVKSTIAVPQFVTLRGDWQDPDEGYEGGTILLVDTPANKTSDAGLITLRGSSGAVGLTVFYPKQSLEHVIEYPYAFYVVGDMAATVKNCTVIGGYNGVGATVTSGGHEQFTIENFKGTVLNTGVGIGCSSDVGTCTNITISPKYWIPFAKAHGYDAPEQEALTQYTRANATGMLLSDVEWTQYTHMTITDCKIGVHIVPSQRIQFAGCFFDTVIVDCDTAVQADSLDSRWGMEFSDCYLEGSKIGLVNESAGVVKTAGTTIRGGMRGTVMVDTDSLKEYAPDTGVTYQKPNAVLYVAKLAADGKADVSADLQKLLDEAGKTGGVVYLPAGTYRLDQPVNVPAGVELRGSSSVTTRDQVSSSRGTMIAAYYGVGGSASDRALVTLGEGAGVNGIRIYYPTSGSLLRETAYAIRGTGKNVYVVNSAIVSAGRGVDFADCDGHLIKKLTSFCFINDIRVGGEGGTVCGFLHNSTVRDRRGFTPEWEDSPSFASGNDAGRVYCTSIRIENAKDQRIWSVFSYGVLHMIHATDSVGTVVVNVGTDNIGTDGSQHVVDGGDYIAINSMRYNAHSYDVENGASFRMYARLAINEKLEDNVK